MRRYFGKELSDRYNINIIFIGNNRERKFNRVRKAINRYFHEQDEDILKKLRISMHRIKFLKETTWKQFSDQLRCMTKNIENIVESNDESMNWKTSVEKGKVEIVKSKRHNRS